MSPLSVTNVTIEAAGASIGPRHHPSDEPIQVSVARHKAVEKLRVVAKAAASQLRGYAVLFGIDPDLGDEILNAIHNAESYRCYLLGQVTHVLSSEAGMQTTFSRMKDTFHTALMWHMSRHKTTIKQLSQGAGVTEGTVKQIRARPMSGTGAENARKIAAYYGKTLDQFMRCEEAANDEESFVAMLALLTADERSILMRQVRGMIADRD